MYSGLTCVRTGGILTLMAQGHQTQRVVWAPYAGGEYRLLVVSDEGDTLTLKQPGADAGLISVPASACVPSNGQPHGIGDIA